MKLVVIDLDWLNDKFIELHLNHTDVETIIYALSDYTSPISSPIEASFKAGYVQCAEVWGEYEGMAIDFNDPRYFNKNKIALNEFMKNYE